MTKSNPVEISAPAIAEYLQYGYEDHFNRRPETKAKFSPWVLKEHIDGGELVSWYKNAKPLRDLEALKETDPVQHAALLQSKEAYKGFGNSLKIKDAEERLRVFETMTPWLKFSDSAFSDFRPESFRGVRYDDEISLQSLSYGLFHNPETDEYLATMRDSRHYNSDDKTIVSHQVISGTGKTPQDIKTEARWAWASHLTTAMRFAPFTDRATQSTMEEASRLRNKFGAATARGDDTSAFPKASVFKFFPAYRHAYEGVDGFYRSLTDIFGINGNLKNLSDNKTHIDFWGAVRGDTELYENYHVGENHLIALYEKMGDQDRSNFKEAVEEFEKAALPAIARTDENLARRAADLINYIGIALKYGSGALRAANHMDLDMDSEYRMRSGHQRAPDGPVW